MSVDELRQRLTRETEALVSAREAVAAGHDVLLDGLDGRIAALCRDVEALPRANARPLSHEVQRLLAQLDELAAAIWSAVRRNPEARIFPFQLGRP
jgi:hypothetical protein